MPRHKDQLEWHSDDPTRRGAYKVKSDGPSPNIGWRYWDGADWGVLCSSRKFCMETKVLGARKSSRRTGVLWATKVDRPDALSMAKGIRGHLNNFRYHDADRIVVQLIRHLERAKP